MTDRAWAEALAAMQRTWRGLPPVEPAPPAPSGLTSAERGRVYRERLAGDAAHRERERERLRAYRARVRQREA